MLSNTLLKKCIYSLILLITTIALPAYGQNNISTQPSSDSDNSSFDEVSIDRDYESIPLYSDQEFSIATGYDFSSGKFNLPINTNISYIPYSFKYNKGKWSLRASSGYISFAGPRNIVTADDGVPLLTDITLTPNERTHSSRKSGFGDIYLGATYSLENPFNDDLYFDLTARVKIPTANEKVGLGTGKLDYTLKADAAYVIGNFMPYASIGYRIVGKTSAYYLQNTFFASMGISYFVTADTSVGISYDYRESTTPNFENPKEILAYIDVQIDDNWGINLYSVTGLSSTTTDYGLGAQLRYKF